MRRYLSHLIFAMLIINALAIVGFNVKPSKGTWTGTVYIRADGSIDPPDAPIITYDNITYTLTDNIKSSADGIIIERDSIIIDGLDYTLTGSKVSESAGIRINGRSNITIQNMNILNFDFGIRLKSSHFNIIVRNNITENNVSGINVEYSSNNSIYGNNIINNTPGIDLWMSFNNSIFANNLISNSAGIKLISSSNNSIYRNEINKQMGTGIILSYSYDNAIYGNNITNNGCGISIGRSSNNIFYHNNFVNNIEQIYSYLSVNVWDDGYPSGGNYWSDFVERYPDAEELDGSGLWDTPYVIDEENIDRYPLMYPYGTQTYKLTITTTTGGTTTPTPGVHTYANGTLVSVTAIPEEKYAFAYWILDGINVGSQNPINVLMTTNHTLHAVFLQVFQLTITSTTGGTTNPCPGTYSYTAGTELDVTAIPNAGYSFAYWLLDGQKRTENPITIIMDANHTLEAYFVDDIPPQIGEPSQNPPPENVQPKQDVTVTVIVVDYGSGVKNVTLWYSTDNGTTWTPLNMTELAANTYQATIPGYGNCTWVTYKIIAYDNAGNMAVKDNMGYYYKYHVIPEYPPITLPILLLLITTLTTTLNKRRRKPKTPRSDVKIP